jgi:hypothetical protein
MARLQQQGITTYVAENLAVNNQGDGTLFDRSVFSYDRERDCFTCPAGHLLVRKGKNDKHKQVIYAASQKDCSSCPQKPACTHAKRRHVTRHMYEEAREANARPVQAHPEMMRLRQQTVEHPFADLKFRILGTARLLMRGLTGARGELSLAVLAYNLKRAFNMKGAPWMIKAIQG